MTSIIYVGMDVHTTNYILCCYSIATGNIFAETSVGPDYANILKYLNKMRMDLGEDCNFQRGYEAGYLGYSLHNQLVAHDIDCIILTPSTMATTKKKKGIKNDERDARNTAKCLAYGTCSPVYVPTSEDNAVKEYIRMRDDERYALKRIKQ